MSNRPSSLFPHSALTLTTLCLAGLSPEPHAQARPVVAELRIADGVAGFTSNDTSNPSLAEGATCIGDVDGDGVQDLAIGASADSNRGLVYVLFMNADGTVRAQQEIGEGVGGFGGSIAFFDLFGADVTALGDLNDDGFLDLAVGAPGRDGPGFNRGGLWILFLDAAGMVLDEQEIGEGIGGFNTPLDDFADFGTAVEAVGDLDGDGIVDLAVGNPGDDDGGNGRGAIHLLFLNTDGTVKATQKISQLSGLFTGTLTNNGNFGTSLAWMGDLSGDGTVELCVGEPSGIVSQVGGGFYEGRVWVLSLAFGLVASHTLIQNDTATFGADTDLGPDFGMALSALGDIDGNGVVDLGIGAPLEGDPGGPVGAGRLWIVYLDAGGSALAVDGIGTGRGGMQHGLATGANFGGSVAMLGDLGGDGTAEIVVGEVGNQGAFHVLSMEFCPPAASITARNAGPNPLSYTANRPILGDTWSATVDLTATGHDFGVLFGFTNQFQFPLGGGQVLLAVDGTNNGDLLGFPVQAGPTVSYTVAVPSDPAYCGLEIFTQAIHFGGITPFALSNAQDLVLGVD